MFLFDRAPPRVARKVTLCAILRPAGAASRGADGVAEPRGELASGPAGELVEPVTPVTPVGPDGAPPQWWGLVLALFCGAALLLYWDAFQGPFFSDDIHTIVTNEYIHSFSGANTLELLRPGGTPARLTQNYAPIHLFVHAAQWAVFGNGVVGYHVVNALLHAVASFLLVLLLARSGLHWWVAVAAGACFLVHPANVESVAWIYQLKTTLALILALTALLLFERRPAVAFAAFAAAILTKVLAAVALPVALAMWWSRRGVAAPASGVGHSVGQPSQRPVLWLGAWALGLAVLAASTFEIFSSTNANIPPLHPDPLVVGRTIVSIAGRYLLMAWSGYGVSAFQEVALARSWTDPWWLGSAVVLGLLGWRAVWALLRRREEGAYWLWAAASFAPISQLFPFLHPMGDRYLYFILPGLMGGVLLATQQVLASRGWAAQPGEEGASSTPRSLALSLCVVCVAWLAFFAVRSVERVHLWRYPVLLQSDAVQNHPEGLLAYNQLARKAAAAGDVETALAALWMTVERGDLRYRELLGDASWAPLHGDPRFDAVVAAIAQRWLDLMPHYRDPNQVELYGFSEAAALLMQYDLAERLLVRALEVGGRGDEVVREQLKRVRLARRLATASKEPRAAP